MAEPTPLQAARFGQFEIDLKNLEVRKNGIRIKLQEKPFQLLLLLLERRGEVVSREELRTRLWPADTFVDFDHSLGTAMGKLRLALGDSAGRPRFIETVPRRGYRFIAPVSSSGELPSAGDTRSPQAQSWPFMAVRSKVKMAVTGLGLALLAVVLLTATVPVLRNTLLSASGAPPIRSVAVLPFENLSQEPQQEYLADAITDELITNLARIPGLRVISRTSSMSYKGRHVPLAKIARDLNVDGILEGSVRRSGTRVRLTAQLIEGRQEQHIWAKTYDRDGGDLLTLESMLAETIADEVQANAGANREWRFPHTGYVEPSAHDAYLKARFYVNRDSRGDAQRALDLFRQAVRMNPNYAPAYAGIAVCYFDLAGDRLMPAEEGYEKSKQAALRALAIDNSLGEAHIALARVLFQHEWNWKGAETEFHHGIELSPSSSNARILYSKFLIAMGRSEEAVSEAKNACMLDPVSHPTCAGLGELYYLSHQFSQAIAAWRRMIDLYPNSPDEHLSLSRVFWKEGREQESRDELLKAEQLWGADEDLLSEYRRAFDTGGMRAVWKKELELAHYDHPYDFALLHAQIGDKDGAFQWLERSFAEHEHRMVFLKMTPLLDDLHSDDRFENLVRRVGLPI